MKLNTKILLGLAGAGAAAGFGYYLYRRSNTVIGADGPGAGITTDAADESGGSGLMLQACKSHMAECDPTLSDQQCCPMGPHRDPINYPVSCRKGPKGELPYRCRESSLSTQASAAWSGDRTVVLPGQQFGSGGHIEIKTPPPVYLVSWCTKDGERAVSEMSYTDGNALIDAIEQTGGGETTLYRCMREPHHRFLLLPQLTSMLPPGVMQQIFDAINGQLPAAQAESVLESYAVKTAQIKAGVNKRVLFNDLWPGSYMLINKNAGGKINKWITVGVENFDQGVKSVLGNVYATLKSYLGGKMDWSTITVRVNCNRYPGILYSLWPGGKPGARGVAGKTHKYTYQPVYRIEVFQGDQSDAMEWVQDVANDIGEFVGNKIGQEFGDLFK